MLTARRRAATPPDDAARSPRKHSFPPVVDARTRVLILGSLPGERSLAQRQYYAHPLNHFWRLVDAVIERDLPALAYAERLSVLREARIGLWDVVASASRLGSLDSNIEDVAANDLEGLVRTLPALRAVGFNGGKAAAIGRKALAAVDGLELIVLPSSSPAYTRPFEEKREAWLALRRWLH